MSQALTFAHAGGWNLTTTLMVCITVCHTGNGDYGVMPSVEYDGNPQRSSVNAIPSNPERRRSPPAAVGMHHRFSAAALPHLLLYSIPRRAGGGRRNPWPLCQGVIHPAHHRIRPQRLRHRLLLLAAVHPHRLRAAIRCRLPTGWQARPDRGDRQPHRRSSWAAGRILQLGSPDQPDLQARVPLRDRPEDHASLTTRPLTGR